jgi:hypothetical protein
MDSAKGPPTPAFCAIVYRSFPPIEETEMSKGMDRKKDAKKKPAKSLEEKRAAKREKKANKGFRI